MSAVNKPPHKPRHESEIRHPPYRGTIARSDNPPDKAVRSTHESR